MQNNIEELVSEFEMMEDWLDKYNYLIELAETLPEFSDSLKTPDRIVEGCQSRVWLDMGVGSDGGFVINGQSDAIIVKGIVALLVRAFSGESMEKVSVGDFSFLDKIGLMQNLSQSRRQGLQAMLERIVEFSKANK